VEPRFHPKAFIANNTLNFAAFPEIAEGKEYIKREFGIPFSRVVLFVGDMATGRGRKRADYLIDIFSDLERDDVGLVLVGSGLAENARARMATRNTLYLGEVHDDRDIGISKLFKMADIYAVPGHVGLGLNQAFYWGLPAVTEDVYESPEFRYLKAGRNGFLVERNDRDSFRDRLLFLLDHDDVRAEFGRNAREGILAEASIETMFHGFKTCIEFLTGAAYPE